MRLKKSRNSCKERSERKTETYSLYSLTIIFKLKLFFAVKALQEMNKPVDVLVFSHQGSTGPGDIDLRFNLTIM